MRNIRLLRGLPGGASALLFAVACSGIAAAPLSASSTLVPKRHLSSSKAPRNLSAPVVTGAAVRGRKLSTTKGSWSGARPLAFHYAWLRCDAAGARCARIAGGTGGTRSLTNSDMGRALYVQVSVTNGFGTARASSAKVVVSAPTVPARGRRSAVAPASSSAPVITGWPLRVGSTLTATAGSWSGTPASSYTYRWSRCDVNGTNCATAATGSSTKYSLRSVDLGSTIEVTVTAVNAAGTSSAGSTPTARIAPAAPRFGPQTLFGVHSDLTWYHDASFHSAVIAADAGVLHAQLSRNSLLWHLVEKSKGSDDWSATDDVVSKLVAAGITPEFTVYGSPSWANNVPTSTPDSYLYVPQDPAAFQRWVADYASFLQRAAARYSGKVNLWECGNEENEHYFWKPAPSVSQFVTWYKACRSAILAGNPQAKVAVGGLAGVIIPGYSPDISGRTFLKQMLAAGAPVDHVAIHPYAIHNQSPAVHVPWDGNFDDIGQIRDFLDAQGLQNVDIWVTEWGWNAARLGAQTQSDLVMKSLEMLRTDFPYVTYAFYFCDFDRSGYTYGLLDANLKPKVAGASFGRFVRTLRAG